MVGKSIIFAAVAALTVSSAQAAVLTNIQGGVAINAGGGFTPVVSPTNVGPGERIRTGDGSADIVYDNGQTVHVGPNQVVLVSNLPPSPPSSSGGGLKDQVVEEGIPTEFLVLGGLFAGGTAAAIILSEEPKPASP